SAAGTNKNSASLSTNFLINQGQATRSTFTRSRVIHFISDLRAGPRPAPPSIDPFLRHLSSLQLFGAPAAIHASSAWSTKSGVGGVGTTGGSQSSYSASRFPS